MNNNLLKVHGAMRHAGRAQAAVLADQAATAVEDRAVALRALVQEDAGQALTLAFSPDVLADLAAAFPQLASRLESHGTWQGSIEYLIVDDVTLTKPRSVRRMRVGQETLEIHFAGIEPAGLKSGDVLAVTGVRVGNLVAAGSGAIQSSQQATSSCTTTGAQNTAVLLVNFPGVPPNVTPQAVHDIFFGASGRSVDGFWREGSYGKTWVAGNVFGWYTLGTSYTCDQTGQLLDAAMQAANADVNFQNYSRLFIVFPDAACGWAGMATRGCNTVNSPDGSILASTAYLISSNLIDRDHGVELATHEGGHSLTLHHAGSRDFGSEVLGPLAAPGNFAEYGDMFSTMGSWNLGHYSAPHKAGLLNWMVSGTNYLTVQNSGSYSVQPIESSPAGLQALKIQRGAGNDAWVWVEYRQPAGGYDPTLPNQAFSGALIHYEDSTTGTRTHLLDFTPVTDSWGDPALGASKTWVDPYTNLSISVQSATASALTVNVSYGATPCTRANPTVSLSPLNPSVNAGSTVNYTVSVTSNDATGCSSATFSMSSSQPSGWPTTFSATSLTLNPGQTGSVTMTKTAPAITAPGTYPVDASAANGSFIGSATANCTVTTPPSLTVAVSVPSSTYTVRQTVPITATVLNGAAPAAGATVAFTVNKPNGAKATKSMTADAAGKATWNYRVGPKDPAGIYSAVAQATSGSQATVSIPATFTVQ